MLVHNIMVGIGLGFIRPQFDAGYLHAFVNIGWVLLAVAALSLLRDALLNQASDGPWHAILMEDSNFDPTGHRRHYHPRRRRRSGRLPRRYRGGLV